jgi:hypothetical protein
MGSDSPPKPLAMVRTPSQFDGRWINAALPEVPAVETPLPAEKQAFAFMLGFLTACFGVILGELSCLQITHFYFRQ